MNNEKKSIFRRWWFWLIAAIAGVGLFFIGVIAVVVIAAIGLSGSSETESDSPNTDVLEVSKGVSKEEKPAEEPSVHGIGDVVKMKDFEIKVLDTDIKANVGGTYGKDAQGTFLLVQLTLTNVGDKSGSIDSTQFKLLHNGIIYDSDGGAGVYANDDHGLILTTINPGNSVTTIMPFDVPEDVAKSDGLVVQISEGLFSSKSVEIELK